MNLKVTKLIVIKIFDDVGELLTEFLKRLLRSHAIVVSVPSSTKSAKFDSIQNFGNTVIEMSLVSQFLSCLTSTWETYVTESINILVFIVIPFSVLARQWICLWSYHHFYISIDVFEAWWIKGGILPHLNFAVLATRYDNFILTLCGSVNKTKLMDKLTSSSGNTERMIPVWQFFQSEWRTQFPIDSVGGLELDKPGGVINAASPLNNIKLMRMNGKQSLLVRSHV